MDPSQPAPGFVLSLKPRPPQDRRDRLPYDYRFISVATCCACSLNVFGCHPDPDVRWTVAKHDALAGLEFPQKTDDVAIREYQVRKVEHDGCAARNGVERLAERADVLGVEATADRQDDGSAVSRALDREVILAAGAIGSPKLLMLSGVGDAKALRSLGIDVVANLPGVGENLQDHVLVSGVVFKYKGKMPDRPADSNAVEAEAYLSSGPSADTDINLVLEQLPIVTPETAARFGTPPADAFTIAPALVQPTSRGSVRLASDNFQDAAVIDGNYLGTDRAVAAIVRAIEAARELGNQHAFDGVREAELVPGPKATAEEIRELARLASASFGHAVGTCKMGVDTLAVVDPTLRVHGLLGLRVADASVMPRIITGPTNAPTHMIAGRASQLILGHTA